ncbi:hypothetical protein K502DRAFT_345827 [Neoconidiobolus thromboides FSU 785]|nr:hypothetical protein K502DRAFT_345827 [Neoconidiobolus thromboides FSU 785]
MNNELEFYNLEKLVDINQIGLKPNCISYTAAIDNLLFIGTNFGSILKFTIDKGKNEVPQLITQLLINNNKKIEKLSIIVKFKWLIVLCDNTLRFYDLNLKLVASNTSIKGVQHYSYYIAKEVHSNLGLLAITRRRLIQIYLLSNEINLIKEITWTDTITNIAINPTTICISDTTHYSMLSIYEEFTMKLFPVQNIKIPLIQIIDEDEFLVTLTVDQNNVLGMFLSSQGNAVRPNIQWNKYPGKIAIEYPFIISYFTKELQIFNLMTSQLIQRIPLNCSFNHLIGGMKLSYINNELERELSLINNEEREEGKEEQEQEEVNKNQEFTVYNTLFLCSGNQIYTLSYNGLCFKFQTNTIKLPYLEIEKQMELIQSIVSEQNVHFTLIQREIQYMIKILSLRLYFKMEFELCQKLSLKYQLHPANFALYFKKYRKYQKLNLIQCFKRENVLMEYGMLNYLNRFEEIEEIVMELLGKGLIDVNEESRKSSLIKRYELFLLDYLKLYKNKFIKEEMTNDNEKSDFNLNPNYKELKFINTTLIKLYAEFKDEQQLYLLLENSRIADWDACLKFITELKLDYAESLIHKRLNENDLVIQSWIRIYENVHNTNNNNNANEISNILKLKFNDLSLFFKNIEMILKLKNINEIVLWLLNIEPLNTMENIINCGKEMIELMNHELIINNLSLKKDINSIKALNSYLYNLIFIYKNRDYGLCLKLFYNYIQLIDNEKVNKRMEQLDHTFLVAKSIQPQLTFLNFLSGKKDKISQMRLELIQLLFLIEWKGIEIILKELTNTHLMFELACVYGIKKEHEKVLLKLIEFQDYFMAIEYCINNGNFFQPLNRDPKLQKKLFNILFKIYLNLEDELISFNQIEYLLSNYIQFFDVFEVLELLPNHWPNSIISQFLIYKGRKIVCLKNIQKIQKNLNLSLTVQLNKFIANEHQKASAILLKKDDKCTICDQILQLNQELALWQNSFIHSQCYDKIQI